MKNLIKLFVVFIALGSLAKAQQTNVPIVTNPTNPSVRTETVPKSGVKLGLEDKNSPAIALRKPAKKEMKLVTPSAEDQTKYAEFLKQSNTGLFKLVPDLGCAANDKVDKRCEDLTLPGNGAAYSFRLDRHVGSYFSDIKYKDNALLSVGDFNLGFFLKAGDIPLDKVSRDTMGADYIFDYPVPTELSGVISQYKGFTQGVESKDFTYKNAVLAVENTTIIFRLIAYRKEDNNDVQTRDQTPVETDKRKDIIVAFRVVRKEADGSITILWRELQRKDSPMLKVKKPTT